LPNTEIFQSKDVASVQQMRQNKKNILYDLQGLDIGGLFYAES
jgi:hypothetical protein